MTQFQHAYKINKRVCREFGITIPDLTGPSRRENTVIARHVAMYLLYRSAHLTTTTISEIFNCNRSSITYANGRVCDRIQTQPNFRDLITRLVSKIQTHALKNHHL